MECDDNTSVVDAENDYNDPSYFRLQEDTIVVGAEPEEVALLPENVRPSTTSELVGMLKQAGTELTVKYLTGEINFEDFCLQLKKTKPKATNTPAASVSSTPVAVPSIQNIPAFDKFFGNEVEEEDDEEEDMDDEEEEDDEEDDDEEGIVGSEILDAGEVPDTKDEEWMPDEKTPKKGKGKGKKSEKLSSEGDSGASPAKKSKRKYKTRRRKCDLPKHLASVNGRVVLLRAQGKTDEAVLLLYDIISKAPKAAAPYQALGNISEEQGNLQEALKFYMVAANLRGSHATEWMELAEMCIKMKEEKLALDCFSKALKTAKTNQDRVEVLSKKCEYFEQLQLPSKALQCKEQMLPFMDKSNPASILSFARNIYNDYMECQDESGAISVLQYIHKELPNDIDSEDVHNLAELLMSQKSYVKSIEVITKHCAVNVQFGNHSFSNDLLAVLEAFERKEVALERLTFPVLMPVDLKSKLAQCFIRTKALETLDVLSDLIKSLSDTDVEHFGDIHYDIAETLVECGYHEEARPILYTLVHSEKYNKAAVWLTFGQCLNALGDLKTATEAYRQVVEMAPGHYGARVTLSSLLQQMGQNEFALDVLSSGPTEESEASADQLLRLHKCHLLHSQGKSDEFIIEARKLLSYSFPGQFSPQFIRVLLAIRTPKCRRNLLPQFINKMKSLQEKDAPDNQEVKQGEEKKIRADLWDVYVKLCYTMHEKGLKNELLETATLGLTCPSFSHDPTMVKDAEFMCLKIGPVSMNTYYLARNLILQEKDNSQAWNLYGYIFTRLRETTDLRFAVRALMKNPNSLVLGMLNGNARIISGTYKQALAEYLNVYRHEPDNAMALLCSALCLVHIASQAYSTKKSLLILQAVCLLNAYKEMRGECQETYYNLGRAMNQLEIQYAAAHYYKKALEYPPMVTDAEGTFDLRREIAYSLSLIYLRSNNPEYAKYYIEKYCVI
ncbi:hypothetical protein BsWGS_19396 [Bradybaena similaris]